MGLDSLAAVEFRNRVQSAFDGVRLASTIMFDYPTVHRPSFERAYLYATDGVVRGLFSARYIAIVMLASLLHHAFVRKWSSSIRLCVFCSLRRTLNFEL